MVYSSSFPTVKNTILHYRGNSSWKSVPTPSEKRTTPGVANRMAIYRHRAVCSAFPIILLDGQSYKILQWSKRKCSIEFTTPDGNRKRRVVACNPPGRTLPRQAVKMRWAQVEFAFASFDTQDIRPTPTPRPGGSKHGKSKGVRRLSMARGKSPRTMENAAKTASHSSRLDASSIKFSSVRAEKRARACRSRLLASNLIPPGLSLEGGSRANRGRGAQFWILGRSPGKYKVTFRGY